MSNKKVIPMQVPSIGGTAQQLPFDIKEAEQKVCNSCQSELFDKVFRLGIVSKFASKNKTQMDVTVEYVVYICRECGWEFTVEVKKKQ